MSSIRWTAARGTLAAFAILAALSTPTGAQPHVERPYQILDEARSNGGLRASLLAYADSVGASERGNASDALLYVAESYLYEGKLDSAITAFERAYERQAGEKQAVPLVDALLLRAGRGDQKRAGAILHEILAGMPFGRPDRQDLDARFMWWLHLEGHDDSAAVVLDRLQRFYEFDDVSAYRAGIVATTIPDPTLAGRYLVPLAEHSRGLDEDVMQAVVRAVEPMGHTEQSVRAVVERAVAARDDASKDAVDLFGGSLVQFEARDGFPLGGAFFPPWGHSNRAAIIIMGKGDTLAVYDSLVTQLRDEGFAVMLLQRRGDPLSAGESCPLPGAWEGRRQELEEKVAGDVLDALRMMNSIHASDTTRYLVGGVCESAGIALRVAERDPRVRGVLLVSADPPDVQRGVILGRVERTKRPTFLQIAPEDLVFLYYYTDALYQAGDLRTSRVSESKRQGRGAVQFRHDSASNRRLRGWLQSFKPLFDAK